MTMAIPAAYAGSFYGGTSSVSPQRQDPTEAAELARIAEARKRIQELTEGRGQELANDPYQKSVMDFLQGVTGGQNVPFSNEAQGAILAQQGRGSAAAEGAQMESLRQSMGASGGSIYDPAYQSAAREAMSQRQGRNLDAAGQMAATAGRENFNARMAGAAGLAQARNAQNAQVNQMNLAGAGYRGRESYTTGGGGGGGYGGGSLPGGFSGDTFAAQDARNAAQGVGKIQPGQIVYGGRGIPGAVYGSGTPQTGGTYPQPQAQTQPETRDAYMTNAERNAAQVPRRTDLRNGTGPYSPRY
jgi:hypothetical protein